jgi:nitrogen fixation protein FixH
MATLTQNDSSPIFFEGWYGTCPEANSDECVEFPLISGTGNSSARIYDEIQAVYVIAGNGQGTIVYDGRPTVPFLISLIPLKKLECGKSYRIILKPGEDSVDIPEFTFANAGTTDTYRLTDDCVTEPTPTPVNLIPVDFAVSSATEETMTLSWGLSTVSQIKVALEFSSEDDFLVIVGAAQYEETDGIGITTFTGLTESTQYFCRIKSYTDESGWGNWVTTTGSTTISGQNLDVSTSYTEFDKPKLEWVQVTNDYQHIGVYRYIDGSFTKIMTVNKSENPEFVDESVNADGNYQYKLNINNGFEGTFSDVYSVLIDTTPPGVPSPTTQTPTNNKKPTWTWSSVEADVDYEITLDDTLVDTIKNTTYTPSTDLPDGSHKIEIRAVDSFGNKGDIGKHDVVIDTTPPSVPHFNSTQSPTNNKKPTWTWQQNSDVSKFGIVFNSEAELEISSTTFTPQTELSDGIYILKVRAKDSLENWSEYAELSVHVDTTPPSVPSVVGESLTDNEKPTWTWSSVTDAIEYGVVLNSNVEVVQTETTFTSPITLQDGTHTLKVRAKDSTGNWSEYGQTATIIDTTAPDVPSPTGQTTTSNPRPVWMWDNNSDVVSYELKINDGGIITTTDVSYTPSVDFVSGTYIISIRAKDEVGNWSDWGTYTTVVDRIAPDSPVPTSTTPTVNKLPEWTWTAISSAIAYGVILNARDEVIQTNTSFTSPVSLTDGDNTIKVRAQDSVGNWSDYGTHVVLIDTLAPAIPNVSSDTAESNIKRPTWTWDIVSDAEIFDWHLTQVNQGGSLIANVATGTTTLNSYTPAQDLSDGLFKLAVSSTDSLGNESDEGSFTLEVDATPPNVPQISVDSPTRNRKPAWTYSSDSSDVSGYGVTFDGGSEQFTTDTTYISSGNLENGTYTLKVRAKDGFENWSEQVSSSVNIYSIPSSFDVKTVPTSLTGPLWQTTHESTQISFLQFTASDKIGMKFSEFNSTEGRIVDVLLSGEDRGSIIFANTGPVLGACIYLERSMVTYWAKVSQDTSGSYFINFSDNFTQECD